MRVLDPFPTTSITGAVCVIGVLRLGRLIPTSLRGLTPVTGFDSPIDYDGCSTRFVTGKSVRIWVCLSCNNNYNKRVARNAFTFERGFFLRFFAVLTGDAVSVREYWSDNVTLCDLTGTLYTLVRSLTEWSRGFSSVVGFVTFAFSGSCAYYLCA